MKVNRSRIIIVLKSCKEGVRQAIEDEDGLDGDYGEEIIEDIDRLLKDLEEENEGSNC